MADPNEKSTTGSCIIRGARLPCPRSGPRVLSWILIPLLVASALVPRVHAEETTAPRAGRPGVSLAVMELRALGVEQSLADQITGIVALELAKTPGFSVISAADVKAMLGLEKAKELMGCEEQSCLAEIAGALGVDLAASGGVTRLGGQYAVQLTLLDMRTARVLKRVREAAGTADGLLVAARRAAGALVLEGGPAAIEGRGMIHVKSIPPGASVELDGRRIQGGTPLTIDGVFAGVHELELVAEGRTGRATVVVRPDEVSRVEVEVGAVERVKIKVFTEPPDARVYLDGAERGLSPLILVDVPAGRHTVRLERAGYDVKEGEYSFDAEEARKNPGEAFELRETLLRETVGLEVRTEPEGCGVVVNGTDYGDSPLVVRVRPGPVRVEARLPGYIAAAKKLAVAPGRDQVVSLKLVKDPRVERLEQVRSTRLRWGVGTLVAGLAAGGGAAALLVLGAQAREQGEDLHREYLDLPRGSDFASKLAEANDRENRARLELGLGGTCAVLSAAGLGVAIYLFATMPEVEYEKQPSAGVALAPGGIVVQGRF